MALCPLSAELREISGHNLNFKLSFVGRIDLQIKQSDDVAKLDLFAVDTPNIVYRHEEQQLRQRVECGPRLAVGQVRCWLG